MRHFKFFFLFLAITMIGFSSCKNDEFSEEVQQEEVIEPTTTTENNSLVAQMSSSNNSTEGLDLGCFTVTFPFVLIVDGIPVEINSEDDFENLDEDAEYIDFQYPLNIISLEGETSTIEDAEGLAEAFASCVPDTGWETDNVPAFLITDINSCYDLVYPLNLVDGEGNEYEVADEEAFIELIVEEPLLFFEFPIELVDEEGETATAESEEEFFELIFSCVEEGEIDPIDTTFTGGGQFGCYDIVFPATIIYNGEEITVADENEFTGYMFGSGISGFVYPLTLMDEEGETLVVNDEEELFLAFFGCFEGEILTDLFTLLASSSVGEIDCFDLVYPVSGSFEGETITINNDEEALAYMNDPQEWYFVDFPVTITITDDGVTETIILENGFALFEVYAECE